MTKRGFAWGLALIFALALALRLGLYAAWYTPDLHRFESGDYALYRIGAEHLRAEGDFSNSLFLVRPPGFILLVYALGSRHAWVIGVNAVLGALLAPLTSVLARRLDLGGRAALLAGVLVAVDGGSVVYSPFLGPEPLANLLLLAAVVALLVGVQTASSRRAVVWGALAGLALACSAWTRPAAYLLWVPLAAWIVVAHRGRWRVALIFALINLAGIAGWTAHNARVFDYPTYSTISPYTLVYYHAASVEHQATGDDMDTVYTRINRRVEERIGRDPSAVGPGARHGYLAATPEIAAALNRVALDIFLDHPLITLATFPVGFARMFGLATRVLAPSSLVVSAAEIAWNAAFLLAAAAGLWRAWRRRQWTLFWIVLLVALYFTGGTLIVKSAGMTVRERSMLAPFMAAAAAYLLAGRGAPAADRGAMPTWDAA